LATKGDKTVAALKGESTQRCSVMLGCSSNGKKFAPYIVFKGVSNYTGAIYRKIHQINYYRDRGLGDFFGFPTSNFYSVQESAWMESKLVVDWIGKVYAPWANLQEGPTILILDEFSGHMTREVRHAAAECGAFLEFIPGGYTHVLQPMDIGLNKPFKNCIRDCYDDWLFDNDYNKTPQREDVSTWIKQAWEKVRYETIIKTWKKAGFEQAEEMDLESDVNDDGMEEDDDGIDFLDMNMEDLGISEETPEEEEANLLYHDDNNNTLQFEEQN
jgi:DDE superfamily endonuclease